MQHFFTALYFISNIFSNFKSLEINSTENSSERMLDTSPAFMNKVFTTTQIMKKIFQRKIFHGDRNRNNSFTERIVYI